MILQHARDVPVLARTSTTLLKTHVSLSVPRGLFTFGFAVCTLSTEPPAKPTDECSALQEDPGPQSQKGPRAECSWGYRGRLAHGWLIEPN